MKEKLKDLGYYSFYIKIMSMIICSGEKDMRTFALLKRKKERVRVLFVNLLYSSYLHFQKKLDNIMQECINVHITLSFFSRKGAVFAKAICMTSNDGIFLRCLKRVDPPTRRKKYKYISIYDLFLS